MSKVSQFYEDMMEDHGRNSIEQYIEDLEIEVAMLEDLADLETTEFDERIEKYCGCGRYNVLDRRKAAKNDLGYWQDCDCKSTLLFPHKKRSER